MIPASYKAKKKFMELAIAEAKRAGDRGDYPIGAVITRVTGKSETIIASAGNRVKTSGSSIKHVELEMLKYVCSGYGRYLRRNHTHKYCWSERAWRIRACSPAPRRDLAQRANSR